LTTAGAVDHLIITTDCLQTKAAIFVETWVFNGDNDFQNILLPPPKRWCFTRRLSACLSVC